ncbi:MAG: PepSY domain-containing protein [Acidimicrobiia bacterium]|nr:PepSY domain-containing protein [Acidimicrobiia bacterium]
MNLWQRWVRQPQKVWLRRALFQIHLWTGLLVGLYIVVLSLTGSVLVYRLELQRALASPRPEFLADAPRQTSEQLKAAAERAHPGFVATFVGDRVTRRDPTITVRLEKAGEDARERLLNPYTGEDLGESFTDGEAWILWVAQLHDELLMGIDGRWWNGALSWVVTVLAVTGLVVWWPGVTRWKRSLWVHHEATWPRFFWDLHGAFGFWLFGFVFLWGISGAYLGIPEPFSKANEFLFGLPEAMETPGDRILAWMTRLHFGRWRNGWLQAVWAAVGLVPAMLFVTGAVMWWNRVIRRPRGSTRPAVSPAVP